MPPNRFEAPLLTDFVVSLLVLAKSEASIAVEIVALHKGVHFKFIRCSGENEINDVPRDSAFRAECLNRTKAVKRGTILIVHHIFAAYYGFWNRSGSDGIFVVLEACDHLRCGDWTYEGLSSLVT